MDFFGIDIGTSSIKVAQLVRKKTLRLVSLGENKAPYPGIRSETEKDWAETATAIKSLLSELKIRTKSAVLGLPEDSVISRLKWFPPMKDEEIRTALEFEAETFIPHPLSKVYMDCETVERGEDGHVLVFVLAALKRTVEKYLKVAKMAGITPIALETPAVSLARIFSFGKTPALILDVGSRYSGLTVSREGNVFLTRTVSIGGNAFTRAISLSLGLEPGVAESYRQAYGLREDELEGKVRTALMPLFKKLADEIKKTIFSFKEEWHGDINLLVVCGGGAATPELIEELAKVLGIEVQLAQPFTGVETENPLTIDVRSEGARFSVVFGLAARGLI